MDGKLIETLQSRKFWATILTSTLGVSLFLAGQIDTDRMLEIIRWAVGIWVGGLSIEDAAKKLLPIANMILEQKKAS